MKADFDALMFRQINHLRRIGLSNVSFADPKKTFVALHRKRTENHGLLSHSK